MSNHSMLIFSGALLVTAVLIVRNIWARKRLESLVMENGGREAAVAAEVAMLANRFQEAALTTMSPEELSNPKVRAKRALFMIGFVDALCQDRNLSDLAFETAYEVVADGFGLSREKAGALTRNMQQLCAQKTSLALIMAGGKASREWSDQPKLAEQLLIELLRAEGADSAPQPA